MRKILLLALFCVITLSSCNRVEDSYVVLISKAIENDSAWIGVANSLSMKYDAEIIVYEESPRDVLDQLRELYPRYVAIVEKPENIGRDYVIDMHLLSRDIDDDIYADFFWGIITGYDAEAAMRMVDNSTEPLVVKDAVATIMELNSAKWFDNYAWVDDHTRGLWGEKRGRNAEIRIDTITKEQVLRKFTDIYKAYDPDLVVTAAHATQRNLEMPFSLGNLKPRDGKLYAEDRFTGEEWDLQESGKRRVYAAVGNCLIGDVNNTKESMAVAWLNGSNVATMLGYVVTTWHGRNGWGALKYWVTNPERYTLAEATYINQQDFLHQQNEWYPSLIDERYPDFENTEFEVAPARLVEVLGREPSADELGFWHDRDVVAYYGDPKWEVRLQAVDSEVDYSVESAMRDGKYVVTVKTFDNFSLERMKGDKFKQEHVLDLPFSYIFPERLSKPTLADGQMWDAVVDENFLLVYNAEFKPNSTYEIMLDVE